VEDQGHQAGARGSRPFGSYLLDWLPKRGIKKDHSVTTQQEYDGYIRRHILPALGTRLLSFYPVRNQLEPQHLDDFLIELARKGLAKGTRQQIHAIVRASLNDAVRLKLIAFNPAGKVHVGAPRPDPTPIDVISPAEAARLLPYLRGHRYEHLYVFLLATGARLGEARGLRWHDTDGTPLVDLEAGLAHIRWVVITLKREFRKAVGRSWDFKPRTKDRKGRLIGLPPQAITALKAQRAETARLRLKAGRAWLDDDLVFPSAVGTPIDGTNAYHEWCKLLDKAGLPRRRIHDTRHSSATNMLRLGAPDAVVRAQHGWSSPSMVARYQHVQPEMLQAMALQIGELLPPHEVNDTSELDDTAAGQ
jgi:integrase